MKLRATYQREEEHYTLSVDYTYEWEPSEWDYPGSADLEVTEVYVIGAEAMVFERTDDGDLKDCKVEEDVFVKGYNFEDIEDRNFLIEDEFDRYEEAFDSFKWERTNLKNYLT
mgnify:CR=1 FL=1